MHLWIAIYSCKEELCNFCHFVHILHLSYSKQYLHLTVFNSSRQQKISIAPHHGVYIVISETTYIREKTKTGCLILV